MGLLRKALSAADRRGSRWLLSLGSAVAGKRLRVYYRDGHWFYRSEGMALPRGPKFDFYAWDLRNLAGRIRHHKNEAEDCWFHVYKPKLGDTIVDVGAEMGTDAVVFSRAVGPNGKVIAIEAHPGTYEILLKTIRANHVHNVHPVHRAVADKRGELHISVDVGVESNFLTSEGIPVPADTLDNILADVPHIDLLKMNIEGAEQLAIKGMDRTIEKTDYLAIACHDFVENSDWFRTLDKVTDYLTSKGFSVSRREKDPREYARYHLHASQTK